MRRYLAELKVEIEDGDGIRQLTGQPGRDVHRDRCRADPALRRVDGDDPPLGPLADGDPGPGHVVDVARPMKAQREGLGPGVELAGIEGPGDDIVGARFEQEDPVLDVVRLADTQDREPGQAL
jgi:hypothetical protein